MTQQRPRTITAAELADEAGATEALVGQLVAMGALHEVAPGRHELADIARVESVLRLLEAGIGLDVLAAPVVAEFANLDHIGRYYPEPAPRSGRTYAQFKASLGDRARLLGPVYAAFGCRSRRTIDDSGSTRRTSSSASSWPGT